MLEARSSTPWSTALAYLLTLIHGLSSALGAQEVPSAVFSETAEVEVVNADVRVTDKKGRPVRGLAADDFELYEDGRPMTITHFDEVVGGAPSSAAREGEEAGARPARLAAAVPASLLVYVDNDTLRPAGRARVLRDLASFLARPEVDVARTAILARHAGEVRTMMPFGSDRAAPASAIAAITGMSAGGVGVDQQRDATFRRVRAHFENWNPLLGDPCIDGAPDLEAAAREYAGQMTDHLGRAVEGLRYTVTVLAGLSGRKTVLFVGDGLEQLPGLAIFHYLAEICPQSASLFQQNFFVYDETETLRALTDHGNANGVTLFTFGASGLETDPLARVEHADRRYAPSMRVGRVAAENRKGSLFMLADETGGRAVLHSNRLLDALEGIAEDGGAYYSLGYTPPFPGDGRRHAITVRLATKRPWRLRYRRGYVAKPPATRLAERAFGALHLGFEANPLGVQVTMVNDASIAAEAGDADATAVLRLALPRDRLTLLDGADGIRRGRLLLVIAVDHGGKAAAPLKQKRIDVALSADDDPGAFEAVDVGLALPPGPLTLGIAIGDEIAGQQSFFRRRLTIPAPAATAAEGPGAAPPSG